MAKKSEPVRVYPVPGYFILGVPDVEQELPADEAAALVETGAFTFDPPLPVEPAPAQEG